MDFCEQVKLVNLQKLLDYLDDTGWEKDPMSNNVVVILDIFKNHQKYSLLVPTDKTIPDFWSRMYDVFKTLETVEGRFKELILMPLLDNKSSAVYYELSWICNKKPECKRFSSLAFIKKQLNSLNNPEQIELKKVSVLKESIPIP